MTEKKRGPGRPPGRRAQPFNTVLTTEEREYLTRLAEAWNMPQNRVIGRLLRFALFGEPLPKTEEKNDAAPGT